MKKPSLLFLILLLLSLVACSQNDKPEVIPKVEPPLTLSEKLGKPPQLDISPTSDFNKVTDVRLG